MAKDVALERGEGVLDDRVAPWASVFSLILPAVAVWKPMMAENVPPSVTSELMNEILPAHHAGSTEPMRVVRTE